MCKLGGEVAIEGGGGARGDGGGGGVSQWVSGMSLFLSKRSSVRSLLQLLLARITNHSLQRLLVTSSFPLITFGDAKLVN